MTVAERRLNRRQALLGAGIVGAGALATLMPACGAAAAVTADSGSSGSNGLEGAWLEKVTPDDGHPPHQLLTLYTKDGGAIATPTFPSSQVSSGYGAWTRSGDRYLSTLELFSFSPSGQLAGLLRIRSLATVDQTGDQMSGQAKLEFQADGSSTFDPAGIAHFTASRIKALPL